MKAAELWKGGRRRAMLRAAAEEILLTGLIAKKTRGDLRLPPKGPQDSGLYLSLLTVWHCRDEILTDPDTCEAILTDRARGEAFNLPLGDYDALVKLKWVDDTAGHNLLRVTPTGKFWLEKFLKVNGGELCPPKPHGT